MTDAENLLDLIQKLRPRAAVFFTYTFNAGYFDTVFLPVLKEVGCDSITVLVDADEAAKSASASRSYALGKVYAVAPVQAPGGGVFHPKVALLSSDDDVALTIGSGNLTISGQFSQLECFDWVLRSSCPTVFDEFSVFCRRLADAIEHNSKQAFTVLRETGSYLDSLPKVEPRAIAQGSLAPQLVHTVGTSASETLQSIFLAEEPRAKALTVQAPFHAPDGMPLLRLAAAVNARSLSVGLDENSHLVPFDESRFSPEIFTAFVVPEREGSPKPLHAKIFELKGAAKSLVMTGSVNATHQSFETQLNVEVSLARWSRTSPFKWTVQEPKGFRPTQDPSSFQDRQALYVEAYLDESAVLRGWVTSRNHKPAEVQLTLRTGEQDLLNETVALSDAGAFWLGPLRLESGATSIKVEVSFMRITAHGWLNIQEELAMSHAERSSRAHARAVQYGSFSNESLSKIIDQLSRVAVRNFAPSPRSGGGTMASDNVRGPFSPRGATSLGRSAYDNLKAVSRWLESLRKPAHPEPRTSENKKPRRVVDLPDNEPPRGRAPKEGKTMDPTVKLTALCSRIPDLLYVTPEHPEALLLSKLCAELARHRVEANKVSPSIVVGWLEAFSTVQYASDQIHSAREEAALTAAFALLKYEQESIEPPMNQIRESLRRFFQCEPTQAVLLDHLDKAFLSSTLKLEVSVEERLREAVKTFEDSDDVDERILELIRQSRAMADVSPHQVPNGFLSWLISRRPTDAVLRKGLLSPKLLAHGGCPHKFEKLSAEDVLKLKRDHVLVHSCCNRAIFYSDQYESFGQRLAGGPDA
ncbi:hypothetical protein LC612_28335 [Nostoc sp. CHAB 5834]|nr:hypothetical protein [Nostoc sp. CHAB 5834]